MAKAKPTSGGDEALTEDDPKYVTHRVEVGSTDDAPSTVDRFVVLTGPRGPMTGTGHVEQDTDGGPVTIHMDYYRGRRDAEGLLPSYRDGVWTISFDGLVDSLTEESVERLFEESIEPVGEYRHAVRGTWVGRRDAEHFALALQQAGLDENAATAFALSESGVADYRIEEFLDDESAEAARSRAVRRLREAQRLLAAVGNATDASPPAPWSRRTTDGLHEAVNDESA